MMDRKRAEMMLQAVREHAAAPPPEVAEAVTTMAHVWRDTLRQVAMQGELGAPDWLGYELRIWELGEDLRHWCIARRIRGEGEVFDAAARISLEPEFGKGRQTMVLLMGELGGARYSDVLGRLLEDPEVRGHAVKALTKAKVKGFGAPIAEIEKTASGWVRRAAKLYLEKLGRE